MVVWFWENSILLSMVAAPIYIHTPQRHRLGWACVLCLSQVQAAQVTSWPAHCPRWSVHLITSPGPATRFPGCAAGALPQVCHVSPLGADLWLRCFWRMSTVQDPRKTWLATGSLLAVRWRMPSLGPRLPLAFRLQLSPACPPASSVGRVSLQLASSPLVFTEFFVLWVGQAVS